MSDWPRGELALVTGASSGIGRELARGLAGRGCDLLLCARRGERLLALKAELEQAGSVSVLVFQGDLSRAAVVADLLEVARSLERTPTLLVNNAGVCLEERALEGSAGKARALMQLNLDTPLALCRGLLPGMIQARRGWILNISSVAGLVPLPGYALYSASKQGLLAFGRALAVELEGSAVVVRTLCPGLVDTELFQASGLAFRPQRPVSAVAVARAGLEALERGSGVTVFPGASRLWTGLLGLLPLGLQQRLLAQAYRHYATRPPHA